MARPKKLKALQIRRARECDILDLVALEKVCFDTYYRELRFDDEVFMFYLRKNNVIFLVAILNSSLIGYVAGLVRTSRSQLSASLDSIAVLPNSRRKGSGGTRGNRASVPSVFSVVEKDSEFRGDDEGRSR